MKLPFDFQAAKDAWGDYATLLPTPPEGFEPQDEFGHFNLGIIYADEPNKVFLATYNERGECICN